MSETTGPFLVVLTLLCALHWTAATTWNPWGSLSARIQHAEHAGILLLLTAIFVALVALALVAGGTATVVVDLFSR